MQEVVIDSEEKLKRILTACHAGGHSRVGALSNAGLPKGLARITILPNSAFKMGLEQTTDEAWIKAFNDVVNFSGEGRKIQ